MVQIVAHHVDFPSPSFSWLLWRVLRSLICSGHLRVRDHRGEIHDFGDRADKAVAIWLRDAKLERALLFDPQLALAEGYMNRSLVLEAGTIHDLLDLIVRNLAQNDLPAWMQLADRFRLLTRLARQLNNPRQAKLNASRHYDLPGPLYDLFLDKEKQYSCAYFA